ncbi:MAG: hypothetical protein AAF705_19050 [Bacteroidota bacterium]
MTNDNILRTEEKGIEYFTVIATGKSGMSQRGLARACGKRLSTLQNLIENILTDRRVPEKLKRFVGKNFRLTDGIVNKDGKRVVTYNADFCFAAIKHYAIKGSKVADDTLDSVGEMGMTAYIQIKNNYQLKKETLAPEAQQRLDRIMNEAREFHPLFGDENCNKIARLFNCDRQSFKMVNFWWTYVYWTLSAEEKAKLNRLNPVVNGRRKECIHQWLKENAAQQHKEIFEKILFICDLATTESEFKEMFRRKFKGLAQLSLF